MRPNHGCFMHARGASIALLLAGSLAACLGNPVQPEDCCPADAPAGYICVQQQCRKFCNRDAECSPTGKCSGGACLPQCQAGLDCPDSPFHCDPAATQCVWGLCVYDTSCQDDGGPQDDGASPADGGDTAGPSGDDQGGDALSLGDGLGLGDDDPGLPITTITAAPTDPTDSQFAAFSFEASLAGCSFACQWDGGSWAPCSSPTSATDLAEGLHGFSVRATDPLGRSESDPPVYTWEIDLQPPLITITQAPAAATSLNEAHFRFEVEDHETLTCTLDQGSPSSCADELHFYWLPPGLHRLEIQAIDALGRSTTQGYDWVIVEGWTAVASGQVTSCAITDQGLLLCWGRGASWTEYFSTVPHLVAPTSALRWSAVATGWDTYALATDGTLWRVTPGWVPETLSNASQLWHIQDFDGQSWRQVAARGHYCAIRGDRSLWCWGGINSYGELGVGDTAIHHEPTQVGSATDWTWVSAGDRHSCGIRSGGTLWCWGSDQQMQLGNGTSGSSTTPVQIGLAQTWAEVHAAYLHSCALTTAGRAFCWGANWSGQIGDASASDRNAPVEVSGSHSDWLRLSAMNMTTCGTRSPGWMYCWGRNTNGEFGNGFGNNVNNAPIPAAAGLWSRVALGSEAGCGVTTFGQLYCWGKDANAVVGAGGWAVHARPTQVGSDSDWHALAAGGSRSAALKGSGSVMVWGDGNLGNDSAWPSDLPVSQGGAASTRLSLGGQHGCKIDWTGGLWCWGGNGAGQVGVPGQTSYTNPVQVNAGTNWSVVSAGMQHSCGIRDNGTLWCWGDGQQGKLGNNATAQQDSPVQVADAGTDWVDVAAGPWHTCGLRRTGQVWCWGRNADGQLGTGGGDSLVPVRVGSASDWLAVGVSSQSQYGLSCGLRAPGVLWCWGSGSNLILGGIFPGGATQPAPMGLESDWRSLALGSGSACALKADDSLWCWGSNYRGQTGLGLEPNPVHAPTAVGGAWQAVAVGNEHACGLRVDGSLWCWGSDEYGQLGLDKTWYVPILLQ